MYASSQHKVMLQCNIHVAMHGMTRTFQVRFRNTVANVPFIIRDLLDLCIDFVISAFCVTGVNHFLVNPHLPIMHLRMTFSGSRYWDYSNNSPESHPSLSTILSHSCFSFLKIYLLVNSPKEWKLNFFYRNLCLICLKLTSWEIPCKDFWVSRRVVLRVWVSKWCLDALPGFDFPRGPGAYAPRFCCGLPDFSG